MIAPDLTFDSKVKRDKAEKLALSIIRDGYDEQTSCFPSPVGRPHVVKGISLYRKELSGGKKIYTGLTVHILFPEYSGQKQFSQDITIDKSSSNFAGLIK